MSALNKAVQPFRFFTRMHLTELTGLRATNLAQLCDLITQVPGSCIYHHTHRFLQQHQYLSPEPPNDFAYWVTETLGEDDLGERLASIDTMRFSHLRDLREEIVATLRRYLADNPLAHLKFARTGEEFYFIKSISFILPTEYEAADLPAFAAALRKVTIDSIYFHVFEARLRLAHDTNDFSAWIGSCLGEQQLAQKIAGLDPYTRTLEDLRASLIRIIEKRMG